jgi:catechol 2,3-dioxygenase-like lactoylglutathione lyase family enzyme
MLDASPLWPATLHHLRYDSPDPDRLAAFYARGLGYGAARGPDGEHLLAGSGRRLVIGAGEKPMAHAWSAFALADAAQLAAYRSFLEGRGVPLLASPTPLFEAGAFAVRDPDGRLALFGLARPDPAATATGPAAALPGELQHVVVASARFRDMMGFYIDALGFMPSDTVHVDDGAGGLGDVNVCFLRSDERHHSFAVFRAPESRPDHHAYETTGWGDLKLWGDHFATLEVPIWWGPGRHGAGNNLFFMVKDPDGNNIEISAELEIMAKGQEGKRWAGGQKAINLWGQVWTRDTAPDAAR